MKNAVKNVLALSIITIIAGFCLGYVYELTKVPIQNMSEKIKQEAYVEVFPSAVSFEAYDISDMTEFDSLVSEAGIDGVSVNEIMAAYDANGSKLGNVITTTSHRGYGGDIQISMGIDNSGQMLGVEILEISETAGLGMNANTDAFKNQFKNKTVSQFSYTKTGATSDFEIDALSGATITTKAFVSAVNAGLVVNENMGGAE